MTPAFETTPAVETTPASETTPAFETKIGDSNDQSVDRRK
jgi:hypothetical protein